MATRTAHALLLAGLAALGCAGRFGRAGPGPAPAPPSAAPRAPDAVAPPADAASPVPAVPRAPDPQAPPGTAGSPAPATAACVDRELRRLGRNAYGDPPGTVYRGAAPVPDAERISRVLERYPEIRTTCAVPQLR